MAENPSNQPPKPRWADVEDDNDDYLLPPREVIGPDANGIKKVITYKLNHEKKLVRVTTTTRVRKVVANARLSKHVVERRALRKLGDAVDEDVGAKLTMVSLEDIFLERPAPFGSKVEESKPATGEGCGTLMVCRHCGKKGDHWSARCPYKDPNQPIETDTSDVTPVKDGAYVPPSRRGAEKSNGSDMRRRSEENSVRVTNLSEDTREADLNELCRAFGPVTRTYVATDQRTNSGADNENTLSGEPLENKLVFTEMEEFVWGPQLGEEAHKPEGEDKAPQASVVEKKAMDGGWTAMHDIDKDEIPSKDKALEETVHQVAVGKGLWGALNLLKDRGELKESVQRGGRNMDKKKSKQVGISHNDGKKEIHIERTDEYGRILTHKEAFRLLSHKFHGKGPGKKKKEKRMRQYEEELKVKKMKNSDTPSLSVQRMREAQAQLKTPYLVLSGNVKAGQKSDPTSGFTTVEM